MSRSSFAAIMLLVIPLSATAQTTEQRDYQVLINAKDAGTTRIVIAEDKAGGSTVKVEARVKINLLFRSLTFSNDTTETWTKDKKLVQLDADSTENNVRTAVSLRPEQNGLVIRVNGVPKGAVTEVWPSNFCRLPDKKYYDPKAPLKVPIVEPDTGTNMLGDLSFVKEERIVAAGKGINCFKFHVAGIPTPTDLWYDEHHRLVREEYMENGQRMVMQLISRK